MDSNDKIINLAPLQSLQFNLNNKLQIDLFLKKIIKNNINKNNNHPYSILSIISQNIINPIILQQNNKFTLITHPSLYFARLYSMSFPSSPLKKLTISSIPQGHLHSKLSYLKTIIHQSQQNPQLQQLKQKMYKLTYTIKNIGVRGQQIGITSKRTLLKTKQSNRTKVKIIKNQQKQLNIMRQKQKYNKNYVYNNVFYAQPLIVVKKNKQNNIDSLDNMNNNQMMITTTKSININNNNNNTISNNNKQYYQSYNNNKNNNNFNRYSSYQNNNIKALSLTKKIIFNQNNNNFHHSHNNSYKKLNLLNKIKRRQEEFIEKYQQNNQNNKRNQQNVNKTNGNSNKIKTSYSYSKLLRECDKIQENYNNEKKNDQNNQELYNIQQQQGQQSNLIPLQHEENPLFKRIKRIKSQLLTLKKHPQQFNNDKPTYPNPKQHSHRNPSYHNSHTHTSSSIKPSQLSKLKSQIYTRYKISRESLINSAQNQYQHVTRFMQYNKINKINKISNNNYYNDENNEHDDVENKIGHMKQQQIYNIHNVNHYQINNNKKTIITHGQFNNQHNNNDVIMHQ